MIVCLGAAASIAILILSLLDMGVAITARPVMIALAVDVALVVVPLCLLGSGKGDYSVFVRVGCIALASMMLFLNLIVSTMVGETSDFIIAHTGITSQGAIEYSVVAQRKAGIELSPQNSVRAGIWNADASKRDAARETQKLADATFTEYDNIEVLIEATEDDDLDIAIVQTALLNPYSEYFPESYDNLEVLTTFRAGSNTSGNPASNARVDITKPFAIYISGIDESGPIAEVSSGRSDANMIVLIDPEHYKVMLVNTPRDYYVQLHGTTGNKDKLTHAGVYGIDMSKKTLEDLYGIPIDYVVRANFDTLFYLVDAMGGIIVDNPTSFSIWGTYFEEGKIWMSGHHALLYARARKGSGLEGGDMDRGENQQRVVEAIIDRLTSPSVVIHYLDILKAISGTFETNIPKDVIMQLFNRQITLGGSWDIEKRSATGTFAQRPTYSMGAQELSVIIPDEVALDELRSEMREFMLGRSD